MNEIQSCERATKAGRGKVRHGLQFICWAMALALLGLVVVGRAVCWPHALPSLTAQAQPLCVLLAFCFVVANALIARLPVQGGLLTLTLLMSITVVALTSHFASIEPVSRWVLALQPGGLERPDRPRVPRPRQKPIGIYQFHPRYGYGHIPDSQGQHEMPQFRVTYTIDSEGCRVTPTPEVSRGEILITGGSFTFGYGVEDDECFPARLAREHWPTYKIQNHGVSGYATSHAYLIVSDALQRAGELPKVVIYAMILDHVRRNYLRESWVSHISQCVSLRGQAVDSTKARRGHPHFELVDGDLVDRGVIDLKDAVPDEPCLCYTELMLTKAFLDGMNRQCSAKGIPFVVVLLPENRINDRVLPIVQEILGTLRIPCLDLSGMPLETLRGDGHPSPKTHRRFAEAIADSLISDWLPAAGESRKPS